MRAFSRYWADYGTVYDLQIGEEVYNSTKFTKLTQYQDCAAAVAVAERLNKENES